ncbi:DUF3300 domain-containing protein [Niveibacterium sp. SC-1]|uniref:DUF3300 domain-containing protein n=1 Tax=Niveibacterium sp. SC-1 TaxID=3135646 RepID=UPI00311EBBCD
MPDPKSRLVPSVLLCALLFASGPAIRDVFAEEPAAASSTAKQGSGKVFSQQELDELLAPIALHPDALLAQILMASTYPLDVVEAARWRKANPKVEGKALEDEMVKQPWDPSVRSLTTFPSVLDMMSEKIDWTQKLGDAFLSQQKQVMDTVQKLRAKAKEAGSLSTTKEQNVSTANEGGTTVIKIEQADPEVVYVPTYNPSVVYGTWWYPAPPPYYYYPPGYVPGAALFSFTAGVIVGGALWGNCNWGRGDVNINVNRYNQVNHFSSNNVNNIKNGQWNHNAERRRGVPYEGQGAQERFGNSQARNNQSREEFRGRAESGRQELGQGNLDRGSGNRAATGDRAGDRAGERSGDRAAASDRAGDRGGDRSADRGGDRSADRGGDRGGDRGAGVSDRSGGGFEGGSNRAGAADHRGSSDRGAAFDNLNSGARTNDFSNRGSSSRSGMERGGGGGHSMSGARAGGGGARAGGGGGGRRR